jgi:hypothetical protein
MDNSNMTTKEALNPETQVNKQKKKKMRWN